MSRYREMILVPASLLSLLVALAGGCDETYPNETYFEAPEKWQRIIKSWKRRYENAYILTPALPRVDQYVSPRLSEKKHLRVAVVGVIPAEPPLVQAGVGPDRRGGGIITEYRQVQWGTQLYRAATLSYPSTNLIDDLERDLAEQTSFTIVDRSTLKLVIDERNLRRVFESPAQVRTLGRIAGADAILIARAYELEYMVYSVTEGRDGSEHVLYQDHVFYEYLSKAEVRLRLIDVSDGTLLWSAKTLYVPSHLILAPVICHRSAAMELPEPLTCTPSPRANAGTYYLICRLAAHMAGKRVGPDFERRFLIDSHRRREWASQD